MKKAEHLKKAVAVFLAAALLAGTFLFSFAAVAADDAVFFTVGSDLHVENGKTEIDCNYPESALYFHASGSGNLYDQAAALTKEFLHRSAEAGAAFVLIPGDLTRHGNDEEHAYVSALLSDFEAETGIQVYVVPGNHDYYASQPDAFKRYYAELGYTQALAADDATASYTADLCGRYRLIAVDSNNPGEDGDGFTDALLDWIRVQAEQARADGKEILFMMHHPLLEHLYLGKTLMKDFMLRDSEAVAEKFSRWGIQYVFSGHEHGNDVASFTGKNGAVVYDILTTSLSSYPLEYREATVSDAGVQLRMQTIETCDLDALIGGYTDAQKALLASDYEAFAYGMFKFAIEKKILRIISPAFVKDALGMAEDADFFLLDNLLTTVAQALEMPLYDTGDGVSIEALARSKGVALPASDYSSLIELAVAMVAMHYYGDEHLPADASPECEILVKGLNTGLEYVLTKAGRNGLNLLLELLGTRIDTEKLSPLFTAVTFGKEESYAIAGRVLYPLLDHFALDDAPGDRDVFLPAQSGEETPQSGGFLDRLLQLFRRLAALVSNVFASVLRRASL